MIFYRLLRRVWNWLPPQTWGEVYTAIVSLLLIFLALVVLADYLTGALP